LAWARPVDDHDQIVAVAFSDIPNEEQTMAEPNPADGVNLSVELPPDAEVGVYADFASVWHTPNTFVLDFLAVKMPPHPAANGAGSLVLDAKVAARVRIPSEQIFPLIAALQGQGERWLAETGRSEPPADWIGQN
jgi:hypothetical protein